MKTAIITDTNGAISLAEGRDLGIYLLPMPVRIENCEYSEGIDITAAELFEAIEQGKEVGTSQPSPGDVTLLWEKVFAAGYDEIVHIPMTSALSGSCQMAKQLSLEYDGKVCVADTTCVSPTQRMAVLDALELAKQGMSAAEICRRIEENGRLSKIYIALDTIECLKRGGRIGTAAAAVSTVLNIKPIISIQGDGLHVKEKVRGSKKARQAMLKLIDEELRTNYADIPAEKITLVTAGSLLTEEDERQWKSEVQSAFPEFHIDYWQLSCSLSCHIGPGGCGIGIAVSDFANANHEEHKKHFRFNKTQTLLKTLENIRELK